ncbi:hypothetical protein X945_5950 [Burkholderia pseudomallei ABCPW 107]|nr:hypothetical protein X945_5950 [Burkholderia pseudomallei ABCPW 107]
MSLICPNRQIHKRAEIARAGRLGRTLKPPLWGVERPCYTCI